MKILHFLYEIKFSGAEIMYRDAAAFFQKKNCELYAVNSLSNLGDYTTHFEQVGIKVLHFPIPNVEKVLERIKYYYKFSRFLRKEKFDVLHIHTEGLFWGLSLCAKFAGVNPVFTFHNVFVYNKYLRLYRIIQRWSAKNILGCKFQTISDSVYDNELKTYFNKTTKIYNWYNNIRFYPDGNGDKKKYRKELGIEDNTLVLISIGNCSPRKNHNDIIYAMVEVVKTIPNCIYMHIGEGDSLNEEIELANKIKENIRFIGNQFDLRKYIIASDIYIMPSRFEGIPITAIEVLACKIPSIFYNVPGLKDFNSKIESCILINEDYQVLAETIIGLFHDKLKQTEISNNGKQFVDDTFNLETNANLIYKMYCCRK